MRGMPVNELLSVRMARLAQSRRPVWRSALRATALALSLGAVAACGGGSKNRSNAVGVSSGVSLSSSTGVAYLPQSTAAKPSTIDLKATITGSNALVAAGVDWQLLKGSPGGLSNKTLTTATFTAPAGVAGVQTATITATAKGDTSGATVAAVTLSVIGTPVIPQPVLYPANLNIGYGISIPAAGGIAPFTWTVTGTLPAGLTSNASKTATLTISGTPTALGSSTFTLTIKDSTGATATTLLPITITVNPKTACLLQGRFGYVYTGFRGAAPITRAGSLNIAADGTITGIQDYKDDLRTRVAEPITSGTCTTLSQNRGQLQVNSATESALFEFAAVGTLDAGHLQQNDKTGIVGSGTFVLQHPAAFPVATLAGDHAFGVAGAAGGGRRLAVVGRLTSDATGKIDATSSVVDDDEATPLAAAPLSGTFSATDANGRGTAALSFSGQTVTFAYYVIDPATVYLASVDADLAKPRLAGRMTAQAAPAGGFGTASLTAPGVLSLWGSSLSAGQPVATTAVGRLSTTATSAAGTLNVLLDAVNRSTPLLNQSYTAAPYTVTANGRATLGFGSGTTARSFVLYLDGAASGYVLEPVSTTGNFGILDAQIGLPFDVFPSTSYVGGTIFACAASPVTLAPQLALQNGAIAGNVTGSYALDASTGRLLASVSRNILGGSGLIIYVVSPSKLVVMGDGILADNSAISWFQRF